jgi:hypothetical protein
VLPNELELRRFWGPLPITLKFATLVGEIMKEVPKTQFARAEAYLNSSPFERVIAQSPDCRTPVLLAQF